MAQLAITHLVLCPAADVTDEDEWFGRLDEALSLSGDARWRGEAGGLEADLRRDEAERVLDRARRALGESLTWTREELDDAQVFVTDAAGGRPIDE